jgi:hypothetical protein
VKLCPASQLMCSINCMTKAVEVNVLSQDRNNKINNERRKTSQNFISCEWLVGIAYMPPTILSASAVVGVIHMTMRYVS